MKKFWKLLFVVSTCLTVVGCKLENTKDYREQSINSTENKYDNFVVFDKECVSQVENAKFEIIVNDKVIDKIEISNPKKNTVICISPKIDETIENFDVIFTINNKDTWIRTFEVNDFQANLHVNVISQDDNQEFNSCLAG